jgi:hypothetical protein
MTTNSSECTEGTDKDQCGTETHGGELREGLAKVRLWMKSTKGAGGDYVKKG